MQSWFDGKTTLLKTNLKAVWNIVQTGLMKAVVDLKQSYKVTVVREQLPDVSEWITVGEQNDVIHINIAGSLSSA